MNLSELGPASDPWKSVVAAPPSRLRIFFFSFAHFLHLNFADFSLHWLVEWVMLNENEYILINALYIAIFFYQFLNARFYLCLFFHRTKNITSAFSCPCDSSIFFYLLDFEENISYGRADVLVF